MANLTKEQKEKKVRIKKERVPDFEDISVQDIDDRIADLVQHIANTQAEIDVLEVNKKLAEKEVIK